MPQTKASDYLVVSLVATLTRKIVNFGNVTSKLNPPKTTNKLTNYFQTTKYKY